jgi:hypothetical protein
LLYELPRINMPTPFPIIKISAYKAWKDKPGCKPYDTDFYTEMNRIKDGYYKDIAVKFRSITDKDEKYKYKVSYLPSITISAVCKHWRNLENVVQHTGLLNLDIDKKSNQHITDWGQLRDQIFGMSGVVSSFLSVSGEGVTFVVKIHPEQHKDSFFSIVDGMKQHMGISVDPGLHDIVRLRFVSDDPGAKIRYNYDEIPFSEPSQQYLEHKKHYGQEQSVLEPIGEADSEYNFNEAVKKAETLYKFVEGNKWTYLISVAGSCNVMGMSLKYCQDQVINKYRSQTNISTDRLLKPVNDVYKLYKHQHGTYNKELEFERLNHKLKQCLIYEWLHEGNKPKQEDILPICERFQANRERVLFIIDRIFAEYASEFGYKNFPKIKKVECWLNRRWEFKFNKVTGQPEMSTLGSSDTATVNPDEIYRQLSISGFKYSITDVKSLIKSEFCTPYDPVLDYFKSLTYDGKTDYIQKLAEHIKTDDDTEWWPKQFKKSLVRSIACGLGIKENRIVMVLYGEKQETGKSTFIRFLSPWGESKYFTESPIIGGNQKDTEIRFSENFIYNIEELAGLSRIDINKLKADISKSSIKERRSYAAFETYAPRRCNFWASTNQKEFLHDEENTRWLIFNVNSINWNYKHVVNINNVWAQAWHLYNNEFQYELDTEDKAIREHLNESYRYKRSEEELLARHFTPSEPKVGKFYSATEIAIALNKLSPGTLKINSNNIGKTMKSVFGLESVQVKVAGKNTRGYWLLNGFNEVEGENMAWSPVTGINFNNQ